MHKQNDTACPQALARRRCARSSYLLLRLTDAVSEPTNGAATLGTSMIDLILYDQVKRKTDVPTSTLDAREGPNIVLVIDM